MSRPDVLIAGAGPAGSIAALLLARAGLRVRLLDRATFPRHKLCGDTLNPGALALVRQFGVADRIEAAGVPIRGMVVTGHDGTEVIGEYGRGTQGVAILRRNLDELLLDAAIEAGVEFQDRVTIAAPIASEAAGRVRVEGVEIASDGRRERLEAPMTIAADGRRSRLAFALGLARHPARPRRWAIGAYFDDVAGCRTGFGEMHIREQQYIGVCPVPGGLTNACIVVSDPRAGAIADPAALLTSALSRDRLLGDRFASAHMVGAPTVLGPLAVDATRAGADGLLLAGDAAGFIDPMTGDGLRFAIKGAELAADVARRAIANPSIDAPGELTRLRAQAFAGKWRLNRALRTLVASPRVIALASSAARLWPVPVEHLIARAGDA
jgi:flavin-dependent dehydrogenase